MKARSTLLHQQSWESAFETQSRANECCFLSLITIHTVAWEALEANIKISFARKKAKVNIGSIRSSLFLLIYQMSDRNVRNITQQCGMPVKASFCGLKVPGSLQLSKQKEPLENNLCSQINPFLMTIVKSKMFQNFFDFSIWKL